VIKVKGGGQDTLKLKVSMWKAPAELNPTSEAITLTFSDDDTIYTATIPAGTMTEKKPGRLWVFSDSTGAIDGILKARLKINSKGRAKLSVSTVEMDLSNGDLSNHFIHTTLEASTYTAEHVRLWEVKGSTLRPQN
jgi:phosphoribosylaminoimidazole-succinocarboxamide synthase